MTLARNFSTLAEKLIGKFSLGSCVLTYPTATVYDTDSGVVTKETTSVSVDMARMSLNEEEIKNISPNEVSTKFVVAGSNLTQFPFTGCLITTPEGQTYKVTSVKSDQYNAAFAMFVTDGN